jgi:hypothetical protein
MVGGSLLAHPSWREVWIVPVIPHDFGLGAWKKAVQSRIYDAHIGPMNASFRDLERAINCAIVGRE